MTLERTLSTSALVGCDEAILVCIDNGLVKKTEVENLLQLCSAIGAVGDIYFAVALHVLVVHVVMVFLILQYLRQVMIVGHADLNMVRVSLTKIRLGIVGQVESILIPIKWISGRRIFNTIDMAFGISNLLKEFPSTTRYLVGTRSNVRINHTDFRARQNNLRHLDVLDSRNTTLELQVDVHHMAFTDRRNVCTRLITLLVVVLIDHGDNLLCREVEDVRLATDIERRGLRRCDTVYGEARLPVLQGVVTVATDNQPDRYFLR